MKRLIRPLILLMLVAGAGYYYSLSSRPVPLVLTGIGTTNDVVVSPQIAGRIEQLTVDEGDLVKVNQMIGVLDAGELEQEQAYYAAGAEGASSQVAESAAALRFQERQTTDQIRQAEANLAAAQAQQMAAQAELENAKINFDRADRRHRRRACRARRRGRDAGPADRHADQPGRPLGARQRRGDLHRSRPRRRQAEGAPAIR